MAVVGEVTGQELHMLPTDTIIVSDSVQYVMQEADSIAVDTVYGEDLMGIVLASNDITEPVPQRSGEGMSWVFLILAIGFCLVALRFRNSSAYLKAMITDLTDTRMRTNMFDNTVRETSILVMMNVMWVACIGVFLWKALMLYSHDISNVGNVALHPALGICVCVVCVGVYYALLMLAYWVVGNVFTDSRRTVLWIKGAAAAAGLETIILFPVALVTLVQPEWAHTLLIIALATFVIGKCVFLLKGFRIFFTQFSSWMLFLYYFCSLEMVPPVLLYFAATHALGVIS